MPNISIADARKDLAEIINRSTYNKERTVLTKRGKQVAVIMPLEDLKLLETLEDKIDLQTALKTLQEAEEEGVLAWEDVKIELGL